MSTKRKASTQEVSLSRAWQTFVVLTSLCSLQVSSREAQVYDRQIRLWGLEAQKRMQASKILISGMRALNAEVCKNLVLAGFSCTIQDHCDVSVADTGAQFFLTAEDVGKNVSSTRGFRAYVDLH